MGEIQIADDGFSVEFTFDSFATKAFGFKSSAIITHSFDSFATKAFGFNSLATVAEAFDSFATLNYSMGG